MGNNIYIGNLSFSVTESSINNLFSQHGTVSSCRIITDRDSGRSKGFGFIEMSSDEEAVDAISSLNGYELEGRAITVNEARPKTSGREYGGSSRNSYDGSDRRSGRKGGRYDRMGY